MAYSAKYILLLLLSFSTLLSEIKEFHITCEPDDFDMIYKRFTEDIYIPITLTFNGQVWDDVKMRIRGETSRFGAKKSLKIKFDSQPFQNGRFRINLNAEFQDPSYIHQYLASRIFNEIGIPCFRSEHIKVYLNGDYFGLYLLVENIDEQFLKSRSLDKNGNLYKASVDRSCLSLYDDVYEHWEKKTNENSGRDDLAQLIDSLNITPDQEYYNLVNGMLDYDNMVTMIAANMILANGSTYYHNYYMYNDMNETGKWYMLPWDLDKTFNTYNHGLHYARSGPWVFPDNPFLERAILNDDIFNDIKSKLDELSETIFNEEYLTPIIDSLHIVLEDAVLGDKTDDIDDDLIKWNDWIRYTKDFISSRHEKLKWQFANYPKSFKTHKIDSLQNGDVILSWDRSISPNNSAISYTLYYGTEPYENSDKVSKVEGIVDTFFVLRDLQESKYFYKIEAYDNKNYTEGYDQYNFFRIIKATPLPCNIKEDMVLTREKSPYIADCNIFVSAGANLIINEGVEIRFSGYYVMDVRGSLTVKGSENAPVIFKPSQGVPKWNELFIDSPTRKCDISYAEFHNGKVNARYGEYSFDYVKSFLSDNTIIGQAFLAKSAVFSFTNGYILANGIVEGVIVLESHNPLIENCMAVNTADSYQFVLCTDGTIANNVSIGSTDDAIDQNGCKNTLIYGNRIVGANDKGISIGHDGWGSSENIRIERNIIYDCPIGLELKSGSSVSVLNNTFYNNDLGFHCFEKVPVSGGPTVEFVNNIISGSNVDYIIEDNTSLDIRYSLSDKDNLLGINNILADPKFQDAESGNFNLAPNSPCIDAGDPERSLDPDGTRTDIGRLYFDQGKPAIVINEINYKSSEDFDTKDWVEFYNAGDYDVDMGDWIFRDSNEDHEFIFPSNLILKKGKYIVLSQNLYLFRQLFPSVENVIGEMDFGFSANGENLRLYNRYNKLIDSVEFSDTYPWPDNIGGSGSTIELTDPFSDNALAENWSVSDIHGNPGRKNGSFNNIDTSKHSRAFGTWIESIYPNPAEEKVNLVIHHADYLEISFVVFDAIARQVKAPIILEKSYKGVSHIQIDVSAFRTGIYYFKAESSEGSEFARFSVIR